MCGIAGLFRLAGIDTDPIEAMTRALEHRGPDGERIVRVTDANQKPIAALGVRRLAIVDPERGTQPVWDDSRTVLVTLNGEIYNHERLRSEMRGRGRQFHSSCDSEVVANQIASSGLDSALRHMQGMFGLAILEPEKRRCTLVRDRMGVKPLYWAQLPDGTLAWASEARSLLRHPELDATEDRRALQSLLLFEYIPTPLSAWSNIRKLEPGHMLIADDEGIRIEQWWTPPVPEPGGGGSLTRWSESLMGALRVATHKRMRADVPVGYLLSGGLDSSTIAAIAAERSSEPIETFSVSIASNGFDEGDHAMKFARILGANHHDISFDADDLLRLLPLIAEHMDEPIADSSLIPTWRLMEAIAEAGLKCVLSGDGADESLAGYPTYIAHRLARFSNPARTFLARATTALPTRFDGVTPDYMAKRFIDGLGRPWAHRHQVWMGAWLPEELPRIEPQIWEFVDRHARAAENSDAIGRAMYLDQRLYLRDGVLVKVDRASMAHGVEVRSPFLDHSIVELCASMSTAIKSHRGVSKRVLRHGTRSLLPKEIYSRKKKGFGAPTGPWLRGQCRHLLDGLESTLEDLIDPDRMKTCIREHLAGEQDHRRRLWSAIMLRNWRDSAYAGKSQP